MGKKPSDMLDEARQSVREVSPEETKQMMDHGELDLLLDVREPNEYEAGHIPRALFTPRGRPERYADPGCANHKPELAGRTGQADRCPLRIRWAFPARARTLREVRYTDVASMKGGFNEWTSQELLTESSGSAAKG